MPKERLSIDVLPEEHKLIKIHAIINGESIREYVLESIRGRLRQESEIKDLSDLTLHLHKDPVLKQLWDNEKDAAYDKL